MMEEKKKKLEKYRNIEEEIDKKWRKKKFEYMLNLYYIF